MSPRFIDPVIKNVDLRRQFHTLYKGENGLDNGLYVLNTQRKMGSMIRNPKIKDDFRTVINMSNSEIKTRNYAINSILNGQEMVSIEARPVAEDILVIPTGMIGKGFNPQNN